MTAAGSTAGLVFLEAQTAKQALFIFTFSTHKWWKLILQRLVSASLSPTSRLRLKFRPKWRK